MINRAMAPQITEHAKFILPKIQRVTLSNGIKGLCIEKTKLPMVQFMLILSVGSILEADGKSGLAHLTSVLIDEGAGGMTSLELNNQFEMLGSSIQITATHEFMYFTLVSLEDKFAETLALLEKIINSPHFEQHEFQREKSKVQAQLLHLKNEPDSIADKLFEEQVFGPHNKIGHFNLGNEKDIESLTNEDVINFYQSYLASGKADFVYAGSLNKKELKILAEKYLGNLSGGSKIKTPKFIMPEKKRRLYFVNKPEAMQTEIRLGNLIGKRKDDDYYAKVVMNSILGGQFNSRINFMLRETKGYTYGATTTFSYRKKLGYFLLTTSVQSEHTIEALYDIFYELKQIKEKISAEELEAAKLSIGRKFPSSFETYYQLVSSLSAFFIYDLPLFYFNEYLTHLKNVTVDDALNAAKNHIKENEMVIVLVGDKNQFMNGFAQFGFDEIVELDDYGEPLSSL